MTSAEQSSASTFLSDQVAFERHALRLIARSDVQAGLDVLSHHWRENTPGFLPQTYDGLHASIREVVLLVALQVVNGDARRPKVVEISAGPHEWGDLVVPGGRWGINNPDTLYFAVPIERGSRYVLRGRRRENGPIDINISVQTPDVWGTLDNIGARDLTIAPDGTYEIAVGDEPAEGRPHRLEIKEGGTVLLIRQTLADWSAAEPDALAVERVDGPPPGPVPSDDELARQLLARMATVIEHSLKTLQPPVFRHPVNTIPQPGAPADKPGYLVTQRNTLGHFRLGEDEALLAILTPGGAGYAAFTATNIWGVTPDSSRHQNSLNNRQAAIDPDGRMTLVVSNRDPGIANWIDPAGLEEGILMLRWQLLGDDPSAAIEPGIEVRKLTLSDLPGSLASHVRRADDAERRHHAEARAAAYARRFANR